MIIDFNNYSSYKDNDNMFVNVTITKNGINHKPNADEIKEQHYNIENKLVSLKELVNLIKNGHAWLPATFSKESGKIRMRMSNFEKSGIIVMDIDNGAFDLMEIKRWLSSKNLCPNFGYYTFSNRKGNYRYRLCWVVGTITNFSIMKSLSKIMYLIIDKWYKQRNLNTEKVVRRPSGAIMCMSLEEEHDDTSSYNPVQLWQGTNQKSYLWHNDYLDIKNMIDVLYSMSNQTGRVKKELVEAGVSVAGFFIPNESLMIELEKVGEVYQSELSSSCMKNIKIDLFNSINSSKKNQIKVDEKYVNDGGDKELLFSRCQLLREMRDTNNNIKGISSNGHNAKRFIAINLKFLDDGEDILLSTVCKHSDKSESYWIEDFNRIRTDTPPVKCSNFCPYCSSCMYGTKTIVSASKKNTFKDKEVIDNIKVDEITLDEAQNITKGFIDEIFDEQYEILNGWEYGVRKKRHHPGKLEIVDMYNKNFDLEDSLRQKISKYLGYNINSSDIYDSSLRMNMEKSLRKNRDKIDEIKEIVDDWDKVISNSSKLNGYIKDISDRINSVNNKFNVVSVPVGVGKTRAVIDKIIDMCKNTKDYLESDLHVCYASPRHDLSNQFYDDLINGLMEAGFSDSEIENFKIVRVYPRPKMLNKKDETYIQSLEEMGISITKKIKYEYLKAKKDIDNRSAFMFKSSSELEKYINFVDECEKFLESRSKAQNANILICTQKYIQSANIKSFQNIHLVIIDEDMSKTMNSVVRYRMDILDKMEDRLKNKTYTYRNKTDCGFSDMINIIETLKNSEEGKFYTFDSEQEICSEVGDNKVKMGMVEAKYKALAEMRADDMVNYMSLCKIKSYYILNDSVYLSMFDSLNLGDKAVMMLSANPSPEFILNAMTNKEKVNMMEVGYVEQKGKIIQTPFISASKEKLNNSDYSNEIKKIVDKYNPNTEEIITFKNLKSSFTEYGTTLHLGNTSGMNSISGKNITVIGTYHINPYSVNLFAAMFKDNYSVSELELPKNRNIKYKGVEQSVFTYSFGNLRDYHIWYMYDEMIQAMGRARACRKQDVTVLLISSLIYPQAEIKHDKIDMKFNQSEYHNDIDEEQNIKDELILNRIGKSKKREKKCDDIIIENRNKIFERIKAENSKKMSKIEYNNEDELPF